VIALYPAWLPEARGIDSAAGAGRAAVTDIARATAANSQLFGPLLIRLARSALDGRTTARLNDVPREVIAIECGKLIRAAYQLAGIVLLMPAPPLPKTRCLSLERTAIWLAENLLCAVWLAGPASADMPLVVIADNMSAPHPAVAADLPSIKPRITPLAGRPNPMSQMELLLEASLAKREWAAGRVWNVTWQFDLLHNTIRPDLMWAKEKCVVEIDGPEHLAPAKFASDRRRDRQLQLAGFAVLRFTNEEIADDIDQVASHIERFLKYRRSAENN
jgi:very-short-patch-repair endonuclease